MVIINNLLLSITHLDKTTNFPEQGANHMSLQNDYQVTNMKEKLFSVSQLTTLGNYVLFFSDDVRIYQDL